MNYFDWSQEYNNTAAELANVIERLKAKRRGLSKVEKKELNIKIAKYKIYYNECVQIADHLLARHKGVA